MKRFLVLCVSLLLIVSLMAVPALAASDGSFLFEYGECLTTDFVPDSNKQYTGRVSVAFPDLGLDYAWYEFGPIVLDIDDSSQDLFFNCNFVIVVDGQQFEIDLSFVQDHELWIMDDSSSTAGFFELTKLELSPYEPEPVSADDLTDSVGSFFSGVAGWVSDLASLLQEPLVLLSVLCIPLSGVIIWLITKFKDL